MRNWRLKLLITVALLAGLQESIAEGTAFVYQGQLNANGAPANGRYDLTFALFAASSGGLATVGPITNLAATISNGLFTVTIDFGADVFTGADYWLEIEVRTNGDGAFSPITPRQRITPAPYAMYAPNSGLARMAASANSVAASNVSGTMGLAQLPVALLTNGQTGVNLTGAFTGSAVNLGPFSTVSASSVNILGQSVNSNQLQYPFFVGYNSSTPIYLSQNLSNSIILGDQLQSVAYDPADSNKVFIIANGNCVEQINATALLGSNITIYQSNAFSFNYTGWGNTVGTSGKMFGTNLMYLVPSGVTGTTQQPFWAASNVLIALNTNGLTADHVITLAPMTNGSGGTYSNLFNCMALNAGNGLAYFGLQFGTEGWPSNTTPGQVPFWDTIAVYRTTGNPTNWPFTGFLNVDKYQISAVAALDFNTNDGFLYEAGIDYATSTSPNLSSCCGPNTIFKVSLTGHTTPVLYIPTGLTQDGSFIPSISPYAFAVTANWNYGRQAVVETFDLSGSNAVLTVNDQGQIVFGGNPGGDLFENAYNLGFGIDALNHLDESGGGTNNVAIGPNALENATTSADNTAMGSGAMQGSSGAYANGNVAVGYQALQRGINPLYNTAVGAQSLINASGRTNTALGYEAGYNITGNQNIDIGNEGLPGDNGTIRIGTEGVQTNWYIAGSGHVDSLTSTGVVSGNGSGLTNLSAMQLTGTIPPALFANTEFTGTETNDAWLPPGTNGFYTAIGKPWTNTTSHRGWFRIPFSYTESPGGGWGVQLHITNYSGGAVGASGTTTNVSATGMGAAALNGLVQAGSNYLSGFIGSNSVVLVKAVRGTITLLNETNNQSTIDWQ